MHMFGLAGWTLERVFEGKRYGVEVAKRCRRVLVHVEICS